MEHNGCPCGCDRPRFSESSHSVGGLLTGDPIIEVPLPAPLCDDLETFAGASRIHTLADWASVVNRRTPGEGLSLSALCHTDTATPHWADDGSERFHFSCFLDGLLFAALIDTPMTIHTASPGGASIEAVADNAVLTSITPIDAVFSFGVDQAVSPDPGVQPSFAEAYRAHCPYIRAFPTIEAYQEWDASVAVHTVAIQLARAPDFVDELVK